MRFSQTPDGLYDGETCHPVTDVVRLLNDMDAEGDHLNRDNARLRLELEHARDSIHAEHCSGEIGERHCGRACERATEALK